MAKQGMARPERTHTQPRNKEHAKPIIPGTSGPNLKVYHQKPSADQEDL